MNRNADQVNLYLPRNLSISQVEGKEFHSFTYLHNFVFIKLQFLVADIYQHVDL